MDDRDLARFMRHVEVAEDGCWLWTASKINTGYGQFRFQGTMKLAHRLMLERKLGRAISVNMEALHSCRNRHCVNPEHLREGTRQENMDDKVKDSTENSGEKNGQSKLTEEQVRTIRADTRTSYTICKEYRVSSATIRDIKCRKTWSHVV